MSDQLSTVSRVFGRLRWKAILLGFVVDYAGSVTFGVISGIVVSFLHVSRGGVVAEAPQALLASSTYMTLGLVVGSLFVVVGGFIIGWLVPQARLLNGAALGALDILLGLTYHGEVPDWYHYICLVVTMPCALFGAWLAVFFFPHREVPPPPLPPTG
jgi:hypothetical protein